MYTEYAGLEILVDLCIGSHFYSNSTEKCWSRFSIGIYGSKTIGPMNEQ